jgi:hypothetical protein
MYWSDSGFRLLADARMAGLTGQAAPRRNPVGGPTPTRMRGDTTASRPVRVGHAVGVEIAYRAAKSRAARVVSYFSNDSQEMRSP